MAGPFAALPSLSLEGRLLGTLFGAAGALPLGEAEFGAA